jgi:hypothetical protein
MSDPLEEAPEDKGIVGKIQNFFSGLSGSSDKEGRDDAEGITSTKEKAMSDPLGKVTEGKDIVGKIQNFLSGFIGYIDKDRRRDADKMLRETIAQRYEELWSRISELQRQLVSEGKLELVDDLESAAIKLRGFINRIKGAAYGYTGFFDAVRVNKEELERLYAYDLALLEGVDQLSSAIDNVAASFGTDGLPAAIRHLVTLSQEANDAYARRDEVILAI